MADISVTPDELRGWADDCDDVAGRIEKQVDPADSACSTFEKAFDDWEIAGGVSDMKGRWEDLNELLRDALDDAADAFRKSADDYDDDENRIIEFFRHLF